MALSPGGETRDLHGVLDRLGAGVKQGGRLCVGSRRELSQLLADLDVTVVGGDHEAGVRELGDLFAHGIDEGRHGVTDGGHGDARAQI